MKSDNQVLSRALKHAQAGQTALARTLCLQVVGSNPRNADAWNFLAVLAAQSGNAAEALDYFARAATAAPSVAAYPGNRGQLFLQLGQHDDAEREFRLAWRLDPTNCDFCCNIGFVLYKLGRLEEAVATLTQDAKRMANHADGHHNLALALHDLGRLEECEASYRRAVALRPTSVESWTNLGCVLRELERLEEAIACFQRALELRPDCLEAHNNLGAVFGDLSRLAEAERSYRLALAAQPDSAEIHNNLSHVLLLNGDFERGWPEYEWRLQLKDRKLPTYREPAWNGEPLAGRTVLLYAEQGLGDILHFVRFAPIVQQSGAKVLFHCPRSLLALMGTCAGIDQLVPGDTVPPPFDFHVPLMSVPHLFAAALATSTPYIAADPVRVQNWRERLAQSPDFRVGIVWRGDPKFRNDRRRSVALSFFEPLARVPGVQLLSLQVGAGREQLATIGDRFVVIDLGGEFDATSFSDVAAVVANLDLVVTVDTALAHLAGAMGTPVWVTLPFAPDWRWLLDREDSPWYPTMRLFRQTRRGDWAGVFTRVAQALTELQSDDSKR